jgi:hypothetical protein
MDKNTDSEEKSIKIPDFLKRQGMFTKHIRFSRISDKCLDAYSEQYPKDDFWLEESMAGTIIIKRHG